MKKRVGEAAVGRKGVKFSYGIPQLLYNLRKTRDARIDNLRLAKQLAQKDLKKALRRDAEGVPYHKNPSEMTLTQRCQKTVNDYSQLLNNIEERYKKDDIDMVTTALKHYNGKKGLNYQLIQCAGTFSEFSRGKMYSHINFLASRTIDASPELFFAELYQDLGGKGTPTVTYCDVILPKSQLVRGCAICPHLIGHPGSGFEVGCGYGAKEQACTPLSCFPALKLHLSNGSSQVW